MHSSGVRFTCLLVVALLALADPVLSHAQAPRRPAGIQGTVTDSSAGVLPGVTVTASLADRRLVESTVTGARGEFVLAGLPAGIVNLTFQLSGFEEATVGVRVASDGSAPPVVQQMQLLAHTESVTVQGDPPAPPPAPRLSLAPVPEHAQMAVCGPARAEAPVPELGTIRSRRDDETKVMFGAGDELLIDGGSASGLAVGQHFIVRRRYPTALRYGRNLVVMGEHSSGLLQIVEVDGDVSTAVVVYACDEMMRGDYLAAFEPEPVRSPDPSGTPAFDEAARILFADEGQPMGVPGRMMVIDRGAREDVRIGHRLTLFRQSRFGDKRPLVVGEAVVVAVRERSATILVERATDIVVFGEKGDLAAPQRPMRVER